VSSALLFGFAAGMSLSTFNFGDVSPAFKIGSGLDLLFETGPLLTSRIETTHDADLLASLGAGFFAQGLREREGLPLGVTFAFAGERAREGEMAIGGRITGSYSLYFARVTIEIDATMLEPLGRAARRGPIARVGFALRFVPFAPFVL
jgi:hypothetical protein